MTAEEMNNESLKDFCNWLNGYVDATTNLGDKTAIQILLPIKDRMDQMVRFVDPPIRIPEHLLK